MNALFTPPKTLQTVDFHGQTLLTIEQDGIHYVAMKPICENLGLAWGSQRNRIERDEVLSSTVFIMNTVAEDGKTREMLCLPIEYLNGWLFGITVSRVRPELRDTIILYKKECYLVLHAYWNRQNPEPAPVKLAELPQISTKEDREPLVKVARLLALKVENLTFSDVFGMVNHRFGIESFEEMPAVTVKEAIEYVNSLLVIYAMKKEDHQQLQKLIFDYGNLEDLATSYRLLENFLATAESFSGNEIAVMLSIINDKLDYLVNQIKALPYLQSKELSHD